jgi:molybdopterin molybdotransferase
MTSVDDAIRTIIERTPVTPPESTPLARTFGRTLRESVRAPHDMPRADRATMDGFVVRTEDKGPWYLSRVATTNDAGVGDLAPGEAVRVATGTALIGSHQVRVLPQECVSREGDELRCDNLPANQFVHRRGSDAKSGDALLEPGVTVTAGVASLLASLGLTGASVSRPLRIRHYTTGDEVVAPGSPLPAGSVYDSNGPLIAGLLAACGETVSHRHLREDYDAALATVREDLWTERPDLLLVSGGAGPGAGDFTEKLLRELGYDIALRGGVNIRPGKPLIFGAKPDGVAFGLPGNPLSHWASFHTFLLPAIRRLRDEPDRTTRIRATVTEDMPGITDARPTFHPGRLFWENGEARIALRPWSASGNVRVMAEANAMVFVPPGTVALRAGDAVTAQVFATTGLF